MSKPYQERDGLQAMNPSVVSQNHLTIIICRLESVQEELQIDKETKLLARSLGGKLISYETIVSLKCLENITRAMRSSTIHLQSKELDILSSIES